MCKNKAYIVALSLCWDFDLPSPTLISRILLGLDFFQIYKSLILWPLSLSNQGSKKTQPRKLKTENEQEQETETETLSNGIPHSNGHQNARTWNGSSVIGWFSAIDAIPYPATTRSGFRDKPRTFTNTHWSQQGSARDLFDDMPQRRQSQPWAAPQIVPRARLLQA